jgi:hypothetical protein
MSRIHRVAAGALGILVAAAVQPLTGAAPGQAAERAAAARPSSSCRTTTPPTRSAHTAAASTKRPTSIASRQRESGSSAATRPTPSARPAARRSSPGSTATGTACPSSTTSTPRAPPRPRCSRRPAITPGWWASGTSGPIPSASITGSSFRARADTTIPVSLSRAARQRSRATPRRSSPISPSSS